jgi:hypothetical protein
MIKLLKILIVLIIFMLVMATPASALMADIFEVSSESMLTERILKGDIYRQTFVSQSDDFGIVAVRFSNNNKINDDYLIFRIKEERQPGWYYENKYKVDQFQDGQFFTFGFPKITEANGKSFVFELESTQGTEDNSVSIYLTHDDSYQKGQAFKNNKDLGKDLSFKVVKEAPAGEMIKKDFIRKLKEDPVFFTAWGILTLIIVGLLLKK